jgi:hypothetical protein
MRYGTTALGLGLGIASVVTIYSLLLPTLVQALQVTP